MNMKFNVSLDVLEERKGAAERAVKIVRAHHILSTNRDNCIKISKRRLNKFAKWRDNPNAPYKTIEQTARKVRKIGVGNCEEKAFICLEPLVKDPILRFNRSRHYINLCTSGIYDSDGECIEGVDHVFVIISDNKIMSETSMFNLGGAAIIIDGWTEDWYFPNLSNLDIEKYSLKNKKSNTYEQQYIRDLVMGGSVYPFQDQAARRHQKMMIYQASGEAMGRSKFYIK
ncbi:hypothetical protein [Yersinia mollaretii]|uniref:hypothetical protein n=1 Tax=Yersinia mollaretii TaxID=33060 RepID=UPI0005E9D461|nr:hypothetical protein [Yersinia mollaretii]MDN0109031.1 hypothetical protein [Yersinia mollaretii]CQD44035.1 Uncharacterised protein [Yersinia mollaretii]CQH16285.1 Uncharacterised protein [Yersinia mollaretii]